MDKDVLWSLRLGFTGRQAGLIKQDGLAQFLKKSFMPVAIKSTPAFLEGSPRTPAEIKSINEQNKTDAEAKQLYNREQRQKIHLLKAWWMEQMATAEFPLREKMVLFWQNHFVVTASKVRVVWWLYDYNNMLRENAFGNFRDITKRVLRSNAMVQYLDNGQNRKGKYNENLSRELLELFTLGIGNYTEEDIKNGAKGLAGLVPGDGEARYMPKLQDSTPFTYFGNTGNFKSDRMVDIIFEQKQVPYFITRKLLKWFIYDNPDEALVTYYADYLRKVDFEMEPFLLKIFVEEYSKNTAGSKIKDPLTYILQLHDELNIKPRNYILPAIFLREQDMDLLDPPNVKGWPGGRNWLTAQVLQNRNTAADMFCKGKNFDKSRLKSVNLQSEEYMPMLDVNLKWDKKGDNKHVIKNLSDKLLFAVDSELQKDFEEMLKYDFKPDGPGADNGVLRLFNFMVKTPEFQIV